MASKSDIVTTAFTLNQILEAAGHTAKAHLKNIIGKLQVRDRTETVAVGLRRGIIRLPE